MASVGKQRDTAQSRERARLYQARKAFQRGQKRRRTRDNVIAGIGGGVLILAVIGGQAAYFLAGPGASAPSPSSSTTPEPGTTPEPSTTLLPTETPLETPPAPSPSATS